MAEHKDEHGSEGEHKSHKSHGGNHGHGGGHEEHAGAPEWLISFADNVALLMGFFVILLAMNMGPKGAAGGANAPGEGGSNNANMLDFIVGMREAFNNPPDSKSKDPKERELAKYAATRDKEKTNTKNKPEGRFADSQSIQNAPRIAPVGVISFDNGSWIISASGERTIRQLATEIKGQKWIIELRGHTSALEASRAGLKAGSDDAMDDYTLSYKRASKVAIALAHAGIDPKQMRVVACSDHERSTPRAGNMTEHRTNQRVEIIVTTEPMAIDPYLDDPSGAAHADKTGSDREPQAARAKPMPAKSSVDHSPASGH